MFNFLRRTETIQGAKPGEPRVKMNGSDFKAGRKYKVIGDITIVGDTPRLARFKVEGSLTGTVNARVVQASGDSSMAGGSSFSGSAAWQATPPVTPEFASATVPRGHGVTVVTNTHGKTVVTNGSKVTAGRHITIDGVRIQ
jgi:hypothetical protein